MSKRPSKIKLAMMHAEIEALRSHDAETQVGAVLIHNVSGAIIAMGCNGFVRGAPDWKLPNKRPDKYKYMVHAEENLIANCAKHGISTMDCTLICTLSPCVRCMRLIYQCGIKRVIVKELYKDFHELLLMEDIEIEEKKEGEYYEITYKSGS